MNGPNLDIFDKAEAQQGNDGSGKYTEQPKTASAIPPNGYVYTMGHPQGGVLLPADINKTKSRVPENPHSLLASMIQSAERKVRSAELRVAFLREFQNNLPTLMTIAQEEAVVLVLRVLLR